jgi:hypothetical protein
MEKDESKGIHIESGGSKSYQKYTPCGKIYIHIVCKEDGRISYVRITPITKTESCGGSWSEGLADLLTYSIRRIRNRTEAELIVKALEYHYCNKSIPNRDKSRSCIDAISQVIKEKLLEEKKEEK